MRPAVGAQQRIDLIDLADELRPGEPALPALGVVGIGDRAGRGARLILLALAAPPRGVAVPAPIAEELLTGLGEMIEHSSEKLEDVPASHRLATGVLAPGPGTVDDRTAGLVPGEALEHERAADAVAAQPRRRGAFFHSYRSVVTYERHSPL